MKVLKVNTAGGAKKGKKENHSKRPARGKKAVGQAGSPKENRKSQLGGKEYREKEMRITDMAETNLRNPIRKGET